MNKQNEKKWLIRLAWTIGILCLFFALNTEEKEMAAIDNAVNDIHDRLTRNSTK
jgi:hypothetical protein